MSLAQSFMYIGSYAYRELFLMRNITKFLSSIVIVKHYCQCLNYLTGDGGVILKLDLKV